MQSILSILNRAQISPASGSRMQVWFSGQGGTGEMGSEHSGRVSDSPVSGNRKHVTHEKEQSCLEFQNAKITNSECMQEVFRNVTNRLEDDKSVSQIANEADKTNISMWTLFVASSVRAALRMQPIYTENLDVFKNFEKIESLFNMYDKDDW